MAASSVLSKLISEPRSSSESLLSAKKLSSLSTMHSISYSSSIEDKLNWLFDSSLSLRSLRAFSSSEKTLSPYSDVSCFYFWGRSIGSLFSFVWSNSGFEGICFYWAVVYLSYWVRHPVSCVGAKFGVGVKQSSIYEIFTESSLLLLTDWLFKNFKSIDERLMLSSWLLTTGVLFNRRIIKLFDRLFFDSAGDAIALEFSARANSISCALRCSELRKLAPYYIILYWLLG